MKIVIAGASGFVGSSLVQNILETTDHEVVALTRRPRESESQSPRLRWASCDLFSMLELEESLSGAELAVYLVHSMLPSARLSQGSFVDFDMMLADNFAKAAKKNGIRQIVYLSGIVPPDALLSLHLKSRLEVETIFRSSGIPTTCLRAGVIIGPNGSSFEIMRRLVERLPMMLCPSWTSTISCPVALRDVVRLLTAAIGREPSFGKTYDVVGPDPLSYREMMHTLAQVAGVHRSFFSVPFVSPTISRLWVRTITGAPSDLIYPLIDSLKTNMVAYGNDPIDFADWEPTPFRAALEEALAATDTTNDPYAFSYTGRTGKARSVRSVQRLITLFRSPVDKVATIYFHWLQDFLPWLLKVRFESSTVTHIGVRGLQRPLLTLEYSAKRSNEGRALFYITGGVLVHSNKKGRLEFRDIYGGLYKIVAIHEYEPRLPWYFYKFSQALIHLFVMRSFRRHLLKVKA